MEEKMMEEKRIVSQVNDPIISEFLTRWRASDMILVGLGKEMELKNQSLFKSSQLYQSRRHIIEALQDEQQKEWVEKSILFYEVESKNELVRKQLQYYNEICRMLRGKPYFIVSTCNDGLIWYSDLDPARIVTPCGDYMHGQCQNKCNNEIYDTDKKVYAVSFLESKSFRNQI